MACRPEDVFAVLEDGWIYGMWVVGAARIRDVDPTWPQPGSRIHHSVGAWPVLLSDNTEIERVDPPNLIQMRVRAWPAGEGRVLVTLRATDEGHTEVVIEENAVSGPATLVPGPVQNLMLHRRNVEALRRLSFLAENHARSAG